jgi:3-dehydroquinate dehydratase/shikimate dehydrogenase
VAPLERRLSLKNAKVLVIGAGGAARAAVFGCRDKGAEVWILNRTPETAQKLARQSGAKTIKREAVAKTPFDIIINATPIGMAGVAAKGTPSSPLEASELNARLVFDLVYNPIETPLLRLARQKGIAVVTGVEMFVQQGARQFEIWTGKPAPEEEMLRVVLHSLRQGTDSAGETAAPTSAPLAAKPEPPAAPPPPVASAAPAKAVAKPAPAPVKKAAPVPAKKAAPVKKAVPAKKLAPKPAPKKAPAKARKR